MDHLEAIVKLDNVVRLEFINKLIPFIKTKAKKNMKVQVV